MTIGDLFEILVNHIERVNNILTVYDEEGLDIKKRFGANVKRYRNALGLTQEGFVEQAGMVKSMLAAIETGAKFPSAKSLVKICNTLNIDVYHLFLPQDVAERTNQKTYEDIGKLRKRVTEDVLKTIEEDFRGFLTK